MRKITALLREWGDFVADNLEWANEYGENIIHRAGVLGGYVDQGQSEHKILCPDMPPRLRQVEVAVKSLDPRERDCIQVYFCAPLKEDGNPYTKSELARKIGVKGKKAFESYLGRGKNKLEKKLF